MMTTVAVIKTIYVHPIVKNAGNKFTRELYKVLCERDPDGTCEMGILEYLSNEKTLWTSRGYIIAKD